MSVEDYLTGNLPMGPHAQVAPDSHSFHISPMNLLIIVYFSCILIGIVGELKQCKNAGRGG